MAILAKNVDDALFEFDCPQWALMSDASKADWTVLENTCGIQTTVGNPYASSDFIFTLNGIIVADEPLHIDVVDGVYTISITLPRWHVYKGTISGDSIVVPTLDFIIPDDNASVYAIVRGDHYIAPENFTINTVLNSLDFPVRPNLNGQKVSVFAYV